MAKMKCLLIILFLLMGCQSENSIINPGVSWALAQNRKAIISDVRYKLKFDIPKDKIKPIAVEEFIDFDYEMNGGFSTPLATDLNLMSLKNACYTCPMFEICNGCKKTIKDLKQHKMVEEHCYNMKLIAPAILAANGVDREVTPYVNEDIL